MLKHCRLCGQAYLTKNTRRDFCSVHCRRKYQNEKRKAERAEAAARKWPRSKAAAGRIVTLAAAACPYVQTFSQVYDDEYCACCTDCFQIAGK